MKSGVTSASCVTSTVNSSDERAGADERYSSRDQATTGTAPVAANERYTAHENDNEGHPVRCPVCGAECVCRGRRWKRVYCSDACRAKAWRERKAAGDGSGRNADDPSAKREVIGNGWRERR